MTRYISDGGPIYVGWPIVGGVDGERHDERYRYGLTRERFYNAVETCINEPATAVFWTFRKLSIPIHQFSHRICHAKQSVQDVPYVDSSEDAVLAMQLDVYDGSAWHHHHNH